MPKNLSNRWRASREIQLSARELRKEMPVAEVRLWQAIRRRQIGGAYFRRQHAIGAYILDFYCANAKLAIELDGSQHLDQEEYDAARTLWLEGKGIRVIRFTNHEVIWDLESVVAKIDAALRQSLS